MNLKKTLLYGITAILAAGFILSIILGGIGHATRSDELAFIGWIIFFVSFLISLTFGVLLATFPQLLPKNKEGDQT